MKAKGSLATMIGWEARRFHYLKQPKPLAEYLKPELSPEQKREKGARDMLAKFKRIAKQKKKGPG